MSEIVRDQLRMADVKLGQADSALSVKDYRKALQLLNEAGVMMLAVGVAIQKVMARD